MTNEKGLFAQADPGIVSGSTIERKKMSTKTSFKRIALVAAVSLGLGGLTSVAPANAVISSFYVHAKSASGGVVKCTETLVSNASTTITSGGGTCLSDALTPAGTGIWTNEDGFVGTIASNTTPAGGTVATLSAASPAQAATATAWYEGTIATTTVASGVVANAISGMTVVAGANAAFNLRGDAVATVNAGAKASIGGQIISSAVNTALTTDQGLILPFTAPVTGGTYTVAIQVKDAAAYAATDPIINFTLTVLAAPAYSYVTTKLATGTGACTSGAATSLSFAKTATATLLGSICITTNDSSGTPITGVPIEVTVTGPGLISVINGGQANAGATRVAARSATDNASVSTYAIGITADGTSGSATVTISSGTTVLATQAVTFYGDAASIVATQNHKIGNTSGGALGTSTNNPTGADSANLPAVILSIRDKDGNLVPGLTTTQVRATSSDTSVMSELIAITAQGSATAGNQITGTYNTQVNAVANTSGKKATLTFKVYNADNAVIATSAPITYTLGGSVATVALSLDKASYSLGSTAVATLTAKDSAGNAAKDGILATTLTDALTSSLAVNKALFGASVDFIGGVATVSFNAPSVTGAWTVSGTTGQGPSADKAKALTASATVSGGNDAAIASLISKINALSKLIAKIQKRLGIK
jgi:hypothetical protein